MKIQHHVKYKEIHGLDEYVEMDWGEHLKLHQRLRATGKCTRPVKELKKIAERAHNSTYGRKQYLFNLRKQKIRFYERIENNFYLWEEIKYYEKTGLVSYISYFQCSNRKIKVVGEVDKNPLKGRRQIKTKSYKNYLHKMTPKLEVMIPSEKESFSFPKKYWEIVEGKFSIKLIKK